MKLVDQFIYLSGNILSTESGINIYICKAWTAIDSLIEIRSLCLEKIEILPSSNYIILHHCIDIL